MWDWRKPFASTDTSELQELRKENREMRKVLQAALKVSQDLSLKQQESLDRVISAKFDTPVMGGPFLQPKSTYTMPMENLSDVMGVEDDSDFLERVHA